MFFSVAASLFTKVQLVGVVGDDFPDEGIAILGEREVDLTGLQRKHGETFRWVGEYGDDMNTAHTLDTRLNVFETFHPTIPEHYRDAELVFLGNIDPELQLEVLRQVRKPQLTALDTMNFWIERKKDQLTEVVRQVDAVLINETEIREFSGHHNLMEAAVAIQNLGPKHVVVKRGEYGALLFSGRELFVVPAFPTWEVKDTTGAGDSFAGGFLGYLDSCDLREAADLRAAAVYGTVLASFTVEGFSIQGLMRADEVSMRERCEELGRITRIETPIRSNRRQLVPEGV